MSRVARPGTL